MFEYAHRWLSQVETPCLVIDVAGADRNIQAMQRAISAQGCALRPHTKTHKMPFFAKKQVEAGAQGITCAKVSEAEVMAEGGFSDIFLAYPMVGEFRVQRALALARRIKRLVLAVDSIEGVTALDAAARAAGQVVEVRLEVDIGARRTGAPQSQWAHLGRMVAQMRGLYLTGIYAYKSMLFQGYPTQDRMLAADEEGRLMAEAAQALREAGVSIQEISGGSTPTAEPLARTHAVTEVRPGTYIFGDTTLEKQGVMRREDIAVRHVATVVSTPTPDLAILDGGSKHFATDTRLGTAPWEHQGYAIVEGREDLVLSRLSEEHGMLTARSGGTGLVVGQRVMLFPPHVCTAVNLQNDVYLLEDGFLRRQKVNARGMTV